MVAFPLLTTPCLGVGMVAAGLSGCWSGIGPPTCTKTQAWLLASPRVQHIPNRAIDSTSNSATLLKAVQTQHKCDKNTCLVLTNTHSSKNLQAKHKYPHTEDRHVTLFKMCLLPQLGHISAFVTKQDVSCCQTHIVQRMLKVCLWRV